VPKECFGAGLPRPHLWVVVVVLGVDELIEEFNSLLVQRLREEPWEMLVAHEILHDSEFVMYTVRCQGTAISVSVGEKMPVSKKEVSECPVDAMMRVMDGRWKGTILWRLQDGPRRTSELKRSIPGITERMLIRHLQELVSDGIVKRDDKKTIPPCVYYSLSPYGRTLEPVVQMMCDWGRSHLKRLLARR
jgi:DNA-binding HxlR family transcriptional regulator